MAFPTSLDSFSTKTSGQVVAESHVNDLQTAIVATETKIGYGADTPVSGDFFKGTGTGTSGWSALANTELPAGAVVQVVNFQTGTMATGDTALPGDDTTPQNDEGYEFMTLAVTPTSATNKLKIDVIFQGAVNAGVEVYVALFQDATVNALASMFVYAPSANATFAIPLTHYMTAGTTSETTVKVRVGTNGGNTITFNGTAGVARMNGTIVSSITITEIAV